ncbi:bifunctional metallophosphatase/5'-nucleotidase [Metabacillus arenae]|uniref:Bifunctional metallophosphatase/5'-nucleotidase n=1 Tax=Metabacillus arenae TaxID=2771434 RepID=A0A926NGM4_9BACI|nr:bifunctional UDP-sugar hydrolase/5'-nucleotidase [Metabacillus arenae]MBD1380725.1 bifunctional metallophosphatase/5'-nucleotidase [Metabacillus arenae]
MKKLKKVFPLLFILLFILATSVYAASSYKSANSQEEFVEVSLFGVNDFHGQLDTYQTLKGKKVGGAEYLAAYLKKYKQENPHSLLVHAGDMIGGSPPISSLFQEESTMEFLNLLNFDIGTPGNHEFDQGTNELTRLIDGGYHEKTGFFKGSNTPYISANVINKKTKKPLFSPYIIKEVNGMKIGFIGAVTTETNAYLLPESKKKIEITDEITAINHSVSRLKEQGISSIIVLAHISAKSKLNGSNAKEALIEMAPKIDDEVDVLFAGHNHQYANTTIENKLIVQAYSYGKAFSHVKLKIDPSTGDIAKKHAEIIPTEHKNISPDQETSQLLDKYSQRLGTTLSKEVGTISKTVSRKKDNKGNSSLASLVAESQKASVGADMAFMHHGGIRANLEKGQITMKDLYTVLPFPHQVVKLELTGKQIKEVLEQQWALGKKNLLQASGISFTYNENLPFGERILLLKDQEGNELEEGKRYNIAVSSYLAKGGDGFTAFQKGKLVQEGPGVVEALKIFMEQE